MKGLKFETQIDGAIASLIFHGDISMESELPKLEMNGIQVLKVDMGDVQYINSSGVRKWMMWNWSFTKNFPKLKLILSRVPSVIVKQINSIKGFVPDGSVITSVFVPYFCEQCDEVAESPVEFDAHLASALAKNKFEKAIPILKCPKCGMPMDVDIIGEQYESLYKTYAPK